MTIPENPPQVQLMRGTFRRVGRICEINFAGVRLSLRDSFGLKQIRHLLRHPKRWIEAKELDLITNKSRPQPESVMRSNGEESSYASVETRSRDEAIDRRTIKECLRKLDKVRADMEKAKASGNLAEVDELSVEAEELQSYLSDNTYRGRIKAPADPQEQIRKRVWYNIRNTIERVGETNPRLAAHLKASINTGNDCGYFPEVTVTWELENTVECGAETSFAS